ncbi:hypothetical protein AML34_13955 [Escherichia coli]|nr:hypothetical protein AML34_13955 [Escherichia coli]
MPGMSFQAGLWCASCKSYCCCYQRYQKQPGSGRSHKHLLAFLILSNRLKIQLQIDELRAELAGTRDAQKREDLRKKLESLERQKKSLR